MIYIVCGVSGSGKTTIGKKIAEIVNCFFFDADDFHPQENINKMKNQTPLEDEDRAEWLEILSHKLADWEKEYDNVVLACSALKEKYRRKLVQNIENNVVFIYLKIDIETVSKRLSARENHFFPVALLQSQFDILEETNDVIEIDATQATNAIFNEISERISK